MKTYYTLIVQEELGAPFGIQFGDYNKGVVAAEAVDYRERGYKARQLWIIESGDQRADIEATVARFNAGHRNVY